MISAEPYTVLADYYDKLFGPVYDYARLALHLRSIIDAFAPKPGRLLELGAGCCPLACRDAYPPATHVIFSDLSPCMLARATEGVALNRVGADARRLPFKGPFDVCVMVMDALNYLLNEKEVTRCFHEVFRVLRPGGLFIVNIASGFACAKELRDFAVEGKREGFTFALKTKYDSQSRLLETKIAFRPEGEKENAPLREETHMQRIYGQAAIRRLAAACGFGIHEVLGDHSLQPARRNSRVIHFALWKRESDIHSQNL